MKPMGVLGLALVVVAVAAAATADNFTIAGVASNAEFAFSSGAYMGLARAAVTNPVNFGPGGTVPHTITIVPDLTALSGDQLAGLDVLAMFCGSSRWSEAEATALRDWVDGGGVLLFYGDVGPNFGEQSNSIAQFFDVLYSPTDWGVYPPTEIQQPGHPIMSGPFGTSAIALDHTGSIQEYLNALALATIAGGGEGTGNPCLLVQDCTTGFPGAGKAVWVTDVNILASNMGLFPANEVLWLNMVAYAITDFGPSAVESGTWGGLKALYR